VVFAAAFGIGERSNCLFRSRTRSGGGLEFVVASRAPGGGGPQVGAWGGDPCAIRPLAHVFALGKPRCSLGGHVAEHRVPVQPPSARPMCAGDVGR